MLMGENLHDRTHESLLSSEIHNIELGVGVRLNLGQYRYQVEKFQILGVVPLRFVPDYLK